MAESDLKFGTSGLRGLVTDLSGTAARRYTAAFINHLRKSGQLGDASQVFIARDLRPSSPMIAADCASAVRAAGLEPVDCGAIPTPAMALYAIAKGGPSIMVTGSHIPADRNGLKFYTARGEIGKADELGIAEALFDAPAEGAKGRAVDGYAGAGDLYRQRYRHLLAPQTLNGWVVGVFEHSSVARDLLVSLLTRAGAEVMRLGRETGFVAVDTEAFNDRIFEAPRRWVGEHHLDALVSTDGDGDRPLVADARGNFLRGDVLGILTAQFLDADTVVTPLTSNTALERLNAFGTVTRTKVGSPYVIEGMDEARRRGGGRVVGFEPNGGVLLGSDVAVNGHLLKALPTRDAVLPILAALGMAASRVMPLDMLVASLPMRPALADRLVEVPSPASNAFVARLIADRDFAQKFFTPVGTIESVGRLDGAQVRLSSGDIVHFRASGNAPELRCYVEAAENDQAARLMAFGLKAARDYVQGEGRSS